MVSSMCFIRWKLPARTDIYTSSPLILVTEAEIERLQQALKILSDAEKHLRLSSERSTWFTAALLQLGSSHSSDSLCSTDSSSKQSTRIINHEESNCTNETTFSGNRF